MKKISKLFTIILVLFACNKVIYAIEYDPIIEAKSDDDGYYTIASIQDYDYNSNITDFKISEENTYTISSENNNYIYSYSTEVNDLKFKSNGTIEYLKYFKSSDKFSISKPVITLAGNNTISNLHIADKIKIEGNGSLKINNAITSVLRKDKDGKQLYTPYLNMKICIMNECDTELMPIFEVSDEFFSEEFLSRLDELTEEEAEKYIKMLYVVEDYDIKSLEGPATNTEKMLNFLYKMIGSIIGENVDITVKFDELTKENIKLETAYEAKTTNITKEWVNNYIETTLPIVYNSDNSITIGEEKNIAITDFTIGNDYMDYDDLDLNIGESIEIITNVTPNDASEQLVWKSSDEKIATVNSRGIIKGISNGKAVITVSSKSGKKYDINVTVYIPMSKAKISSIPDQVYTGKEIKPAIKVTYKDKELVLNKDYELSYENNIKVGRGYVYIEGLGDYSGYTFATFNIISDTIFTAKQSARTNNSVTLKWTKPTAKTTGYQIYMSTSVDGKYKKVATISKSSTTSYKQTKLTAGTKYYFKIRNYYKSGKNIVYGSFIDVTATTAVNTPSIKTVSNASAVKVSWNKVSKAAGYEVYQSTDKKTYTKVGTTKDLSYMVEKLNSATTYYYKVRAYTTIDNVNVYGSYSKAVSITTKPVTPVVTATALTYNYATISWDKVSRITGYEVYRSTNGKKYSKIKTLKTNSLKNTGLNVGTTYYYKVRAYKTVSGKKIYSGYSTVITAKPYLKATTITGYNDYYDYAKITYTKISGANGYKIYRADSKDGKYTNIGKTTNLYYNDKTAKEGLTYYYKVIAYRNINKKAKNGLTSKEASATRLAYTLKFSVNTNTYNSNRIEILKDKTALKYYIYRATSKSGKYTLISTLKASDFKENIEYIDSKLTFNKTYYYKIRISYKNTSNYSAVKSIKTKLSSPVLSKENTDKNITIKYDKVAGATGYEIYRSNDGVNYSKIKTITANSYIDNNIVQGKTYYYKVRAYKTVNKTKYYSLLSSELKVELKNNEIKLDKPVLIIHSIKDACGKDCDDVDPTLNYAYVDDKFVYEITADIKMVEDKYLADGFELYILKDNEYTLVKDINKISTISIEKELNVIDTYAIRTYKLNDKNEKVYSEYSDSVVIGAMLGDLNADHKIDEADVTKLLDYINKPLREFAIELSDIDNNGEINLSDYYLLDNYVKGNIKKLNYDGLLTPSIEVEAKSTPGINGSTNVIFNIKNINGTHIEYYATTDEVEFELKGEQEITDYYKNGNIDITIPVIADRFGFRVRTYKIVNNEKVYSEYSIIKYYD